MDLQKLQAFLTLAECKNFSEAAEQLYLSQPAISKQIQTLEDDLGAPLFNRGNKQTTLTIQGERFLPYALEIVNLYQTAQEHLAQLEHLNEGIISFGATHFIGVYIMPAIIATFQKEYPNIEINMKISNSKALLADLEHRKLEFLILSDYIATSENKHHVRVFMEDELVIIASKNHPLAQKEYCDLTELANETFINKDRSSQLHFIEEELEKHQFTIKQGIKISNQEGIKQAVIHNLGLSIMSAKAIATEVAVGQLAAIRIKNINLVRGIQLTYDKRRFLTPAAKAFFDYL